MSRTWTAGRRELLITRSNVGSATCLMALNAATGGFQWRTADYMQSYVSNSVADIDGDGRFEVFHTDKGNFVYCDNPDGARRWQIELAGSGVFWAPAVADVDGDGHVEILAGCRSTDPKTGNCFYVVSDAGVLKQAMALGGGANASPVVADLDGDGKLEVVVAVENPNQLMALTWDGAGRVAWPSLRGDSRMSGAPRIGASAPTGVEDYRALYVLRREIEQARSAGRVEEADRAQALMDEAVEKVAGWQVGVIDEITRQTREYEVDFDLLLEYRAAIARAIVRLREVK